MKIYNYDQNGKLIGSSKADPSPLEEGMYLIPARATDQEPPVPKNGFDIYWNETKWEYRPVPNPKPEQPNEYSVWDELTWNWVEDPDLKAKYVLRLDSETRNKEMLSGFVYGTNTDGSERRISVTKDDGDGMVQVKASFELGLSSTVIHFANGTKLPMTSEEFPAFALQFVTERGKFFS